MNYCGSSEPRSSPPPPRGGLLLAYGSHAASAVGEQQVPKPKMQSVRTVRAAASARGGPLLAFAHQADIRRLLPENFSINDAYGSLLTPKTITTQS